jgi:hypothetical protein
MTSTSIYPLESGRPYTIGELRTSADNNSRAPKRCREEGLRPGKIRKGLSGR